MIGKKSIGSKVLKGSALLTCGQFVSYGCSFLRNIILARVLSKADFGIAATFALILAAFELCTKMAINQQVIQDKDGNSEKFISNAHFCQLIAAVSSSILLLGLSGKIANFFNIPDLDWTIALLGFVSLMRGLIHLENSQKIRDINYRDSILVDAVPQIAITLFAYPAVVYFSDFRAVVFLIIAKTFLSMSLSHYFASNRFKLAFDFEIVKRILRFSGPLILSSTLLFVYNQGDQLLVAARYSMEDLAVFSVATSLTLVPGYMFIQVMRSLMLPLLAKVQDDKKSFEQRYKLCLELSTIGAISLACLLIICGETIAIWTFGLRYQTAGSIIVWLACANSLRIIRAASSVAALARGDTVNNLIASVFRCASLCISIPIALNGYSMKYVAIAALMGEIFALIPSWYRLYTHCGIPIGASMKPVIFSIFSLTTLVAVNYFYIVSIDWYIIFTIAALMIVVFNVGMWAIFKEYRKCAIFYVDQYGLTQLVKKI